MQELPIDPVGGEFVRRAQVDITQEAGAIAQQRPLEAKIAGLTPAQVNDALRKYITPATLSFVSAGDFAKVGGAAGATK